MTTTRMLLRSLEQIIPGCFCLKMDPSQPTATKDTLLSCQLKKYKLYQYSCNLTVFTLYLKKKKKKQRQRQQQQLERY